MVAPEVMDRVDRVLARILETDIELRQLGERRWRGTCVGCGDDTMELKVDLDDRRLYLDCWHTSCPPHSLLQALDLTEEDLRPPPRREPSRLVRHRLADVKLEKVEFLVPGVPRRAVTLVGGDPGLGKSMWTCLVAAETSLGSRAVAILNAEDTRSVVRGRVQAAGGNLELVEILVKEDGAYEEALSLPEDVGHLEAFETDTDAALIVIDPLMAFLSDKADANQDHSIRRALANLALMADRRDVAVVVCAHLNKDEQKSVLYRVGGSVGLVGAARSLLLFATDPDDPKKRLLAHAKANWVELGQTRRFKLNPTTVEQDGERIATALLHADGFSDLSAEQIIGRQRAEGKLSEATDAIQAAVAGTERLSREVKAEVAAEAGCSVGTIQRAAEQLKASGQLEVQRVGNQTYWKDPAAASQAASQVGLKDDVAKPDEGADKGRHTRARARKEVQASQSASQHHPGEGLAKPDEKPEPGANGEPAEAEKRAKLERILRGEG